MGNISPTMVNGDSGIVLGGCGITAHKAIKDFEVTGGWRAMRGSLVTCLCSIDLYRWIPKIKNTEEGSHLLCNFYYVLIRRSVLSHDIYISDT